MKDLFNTEYYVQALMIIEEAFGEDVAYSTDQCLEIEEEYWDNYMNRDHWGE